MYSNDQKPVAPEVGKRYFTRDGSISGRMLFFDVDDYPFEDSNGELYTAKGYYYGPNPAHPSDLMEEAFVFRKDENGELIPV